MIPYDRVREQVTANEHHASRKLLRHKLVNKIKAKVLVLFTPTALCFQPGQAQGTRQRSVPMEEVFYQGNLMQSWR